MAGVARAYGKRRQHRAELADQVSNMIVNEAEEIVPLLMQAQSVEPDVPIERLV